MRTSPSPVSPVLPAPLQPVHSLSSASGLPQKEKRLGLSNELPASKRTRRRLNPECRKTNGNLPRPPRGTEGTRAIPAGPTDCRALAPAPTAARPSPPSQAGGLTSSGGSVNLLALQDALLAVPCQGGGRQAARVRLHLMEKRGESLDLECVSKGCKESEHHHCRQPQHRGGDTHGKGFQSTQPMELIAIQRQQKTNNLGRCPNSVFNEHGDSRSPWRPLCKAGSLTSRWHPLQSFFSRHITWKGDFRPRTPSPDLQRQVLCSLNHPTSIYFPAGQAGGGFPKSGMQLGAHRECSSWVCYFLVKKLQKGQAQLDSFQAPFLWQ